MPFPSPDQRRVIEHRGKPIVVVAGPGTGKTKTIVARMIQLLLEDPSRNISFVTFTRTSRTDTSQKLSRELPASYVDQSQSLAPRVGTLHAGATAMVRRFAASVGLSPHFSIFVADKGERELVVADVLHDVGLRVGPQALCKGIESYLRDLAVVEGPHFSEDEFWLAFDRYLELLRFYNSLGMEEIVFNAIQILQNHAEQAPPLFLQVDEYQDLNVADQRFVKSVASNPRSEVVVVGDDAQSIYGFRGANFQGLRDLSESPDWELLRFPDCHRLPAHVQRAALALISGCGYLGSAMNPRPDNGRRVLTFQCTKSEYQGRIVAREITGFLARHTRADGSPISYSDVIVLCPSGNFVAGMREALLKVDIPSREVARPVVPDHMWKVILILRFALNHDNIAFRSWLDVVNVDPVDIDAVRRAAMDEQTNLIGYCENGPNVDARTVLEHAKHLREHSDGTPELAAALAAFPGLELSEEAITEIVSYLLRGDGSLSPRREWLGILYRKYGILEDESASGPDDAVLVTTFHSAKGLEGELVCLTWMNDLHMPLAGRDVEEQRRLLYVGMTRAKQELIITFHETFEEGRGLLRIEAMSRFLRGIISYLTVTRIMAKDLL